MAKDAAFQRLWTKYAALPNYIKEEWTAAYNEIWTMPEQTPSDWSDKELIKKVMFIATENYNTKDVEYKTLKEACERIGQEPA